MPDYRAYKIEKGHITGVPVIITCGTDQEAIEQAKPLVNGCDVELWEGARVVVILKSSDVTRRAT